MPYIIDMEFDSLHGEDIRSFKAIVGKEYEFKYKYKYKAEGGNLKIEFSDSEGNIISKFPDGKDLKANEDKKDNIIIGEIGGILKVKSVDERINIIITGEDAAGYIKINW